MIAIVLVFVTIRVVTDAPNVAAGLVPNDGFERWYAEHPVIACASILPGVVCLLGAPFQLSRRFRERDVE